MLKNNFIYQLFSYYKYTLGLGWKISKKRVVSEFIYTLFGYVDFLIVGAVLMRIILDMAVKQVSFGKIMACVWAVVALSVAMSIFNKYYDQFVKPITDVEMYSKLNRMLYKKACQVDLACFENSEFYNRYMLAINQAHVKIPGSLTSICQMLAGFVSMVAAFTVIYQIDRLAILFVIFPILGNFVFYGILNSRIFKMEKENIVFGRIADYVNRTIHLSDYAKEIRMTNVYRLLKKQYDKAIESMHRVIGKYTVGNIILFWLFQYFTFTILQEGALMYAGYRVLVSGTMVFAQFAVIMTTMNCNTWTLLNFADAVMETVKNRLYVEQIREFLEYEPKIAEDEDGLIPQLPVTSIEFSHVYFGYKEDHYILKDISFKIDGNQSVALAGFNGAGKSTLIKLLLRLYDPDKGNILVNGIDIRKYQVQAYRELFATAFQDGKIFADTLEENILMGQHENENADFQKVWKALSLAGFAQEVRLWEKQEKTIMTREFSKEGVVLSGGQNQKILAARAFAKDCAVAVFDEPSSALDPLAEYDLFQNIQKFGQGKMLFFISHRLSSVQDADVVFFMENGRIHERGSHKELMEMDGKYAALYNLQAEKYRAEISGNYLEKGFMSEGKKDNPAGKEPRKQDRKEGNA